MVSGSVSQTLVTCQSDFERKTRRLSHGNQVACVLITDYKYSRMLTNVSILYDLCNVCWMALCEIRHPEPDIAFFPSLVHHILMTPCRPSVTSCMTGAPSVCRRLAGAGTRTDWAVEGRRVVPVLPRGRPITAYTAVADASRARTERLAGRLPLPADTRSYEPGQMGDMGGEGRARSARGEMYTSFMETCSIYLLFLHQISKLTLMFYWFLSDI